MGADNDTNAEQRAPQDGATISALARQHGVSRATVLGIIQVAAKEQAPASTAPAKAAKGIRKRVKAGVDDETDIERRAALERQHGQLRLHL